MIPLGQLNMLTTGLQIGGSLLSGFTSNANAKLQANQLEWEAKQAEKAGRKQAEQVRKAGEFAKGQMVVDIQQSGFENTGSAADIMLEQMRGVENDVFQTILSGDLEALSKRSQAASVRAQGKQAMIGGLFGAGMGLAGGAIKGAALKESGIFDAKPNLKNLSLLGMF